MIGDLERRHFLRLVSAPLVATACGEGTAPATAPSPSRATPPPPPDPSPPALPPADPPPVRDGAWMTTGLEFPELASFDEALRYFMEPLGIPGGSLAVTRNGRLVLARGYTDESVSDDDDLITEPTSLFRIASISKPITAAAVLRLVEDGELELSAKLTELLSLTPPPGQRPDPRLHDVTVLNLLQNLAGFPRDWPWPDQEISEALGVPLPISQADIATYMTGQPLEHPPGTTYLYSNYGYLLLGLLIERVTGTPYEEYVTNRVWRPLDVTRSVLGRALEEHRRPGEVKYHDPRSYPTVMDDSGAIVPCPYGGVNWENWGAGGSWLSSAVDVVRFAAALDEPAASPVLNAASIEIMFGLPENIGPAAYTLGDPYYACGWQVRDYGNGSRNTWHSGGGCGQRTFLVRRRDGLSWAVLFNRSDANVDYGEIYRLLDVAADSVARWPDHDLFDRYLDLT